MKVDKNRPLIIIKSRRNSTNEGRHFFATENYRGPSLHHVCTAYSVSWPTYRDSLFQFPWNKLIGKLTLTATCFTDNKFPATLAGYSTGSRGPPIKSEDPAIRKLVYRYLQFSNEFADVTRFRGAGDVTQHALNVGLVDRCLQSLGYNVEFRVNNVDADRVDRGIGQVVRQLTQCCQVEHLMAEIWTRLFQPSHSLSRHLYCNRPPKNLCRMEAKLIGSSPSHASTTPSLTDVTPSWRHGVDFF